ncbi:MAG: adenylyl-sulfate kinase [Chloroflexi bacterium]|nr:adenylyl-sulfate kinase [Chloroflexota bacterium]
MTTASKGVCIWLTGLSGAGKSTIAQALLPQLQAHGRAVTMLDGDVVRTHLSKGLGFSREDRDTNVLRIGFVAGEVLRHGGVAVCAVISPYRAARDAVRAVVNSTAPDALGGFVEAFVATSIEECEKRDVKGLYARARRGELTGFTGIDDPYEAPLHPEVMLDTIGASPDACAEKIVRYLTHIGRL